MYGASRVTWFCVVLVLAAVLLSAWLLLASRPDSEEVPPFEILYSGSLPGGGRPGVRLMTPGGDSKLLLPRYDIVASDKRGIWAAKRFTYGDANTSRTFMEYGPGGNRPLPLKLYETLLGWNPATREWMLWSSRDHIIRGSKGKAAPSGPLLPEVDDVWVYDADWNRDGTAVVCVDQSIADTTELQSQWFKVYPDGTACRFDCQASKLRWSSEGDTLVGLFGANPSELRWSMRGEPAFCRRWRPRKRPLNLLIAGPVIFDFQCSTRSGWISVQYYEDNVSLSASAMLVNLRTGASRKVIENGVGGKSVWAIPVTDSSQ